jgi:DNA-binding MarR family transcriptional regulator
MENAKHQDQEAKLHPPADADATLDGAGNALFRLGRLFARRSAQHISAEHTGRPVELSRILVAEAVAAGPDLPGGDITVGLVADRLAVEPSTASRLVADAIRDGYLTRAASAGDARRLRLTLTPTGETLVADARRYQRATFEQMTRDWTDRERAEFARLLARFTDTLADHLTSPSPNPHKPD